MKLKTVLAVSLILFGVLAFVYQGISYTTVGRGMSMSWMRLATQRLFSLPVPPIVGTIALIVGIAWLLADKRDFHSAATPQRVPRRHPPFR